MRVCFLMLVSLAGCEVTPNGGTDFTSIRDEVLLPSCAFSSCHGGTNAGGLVLDEAGAYDALVGVESTAADATLVVPGDAAASYLMQKLDGDAGIEGDPMPPSGLLDARTVERIRVWIDDGAAND